MEKSLCILGRQPALGMAELESLYGAEMVRPVGSQAAIINHNYKDINFARLGGSMRLCEVLDILDTFKWPEIEKHILTYIPSQLRPETNSKIQLGLSVIDLEVSVPRLMATGLKLKKVIQSSGHSVRFIPNKVLLLNAAQVIHNGLINPNGCELLLVRSNDKTYLARTVNVQDIANYTIRDRYRPKRDSRVGMLPPKLAQIIINLAGQELQFETVSNHPRLVRPVRPINLLDPFCGTGVILQEALLMGYGVIGTDIEPRMVEYSRTNLEWFKAKFKLPANDYRLDVADATTHNWDYQFTLIASETYLGRPFTNYPGSDLLAQTINDCNLILRKFLINIRDQLSPGTRLCLAVPAWQVDTGVFKHLSFIDRLSDLGYNRVSFKHVMSDHLLYYRENQIVGRELLVLIRK